MRKSELTLDSRNTQERLQQGLSLPKINVQSLDLNLKEMGKRNKVKRTHEMVHIRTEINKIKNSKENQTSGLCVKNRINW